jgi:hypothetical protein
MLRFSLTRLLAVASAVAVYFGVLAGTARLLNLGTGVTFAVWLMEISRLPIYALWMAAACAAFERRNAYPASTKCAMLAILGFGCTSALNAVFQMWFMVAITGPQPSAGMLWFAWHVVAHPLLGAACWALLLFALLYAMNRREQIDPPSDGFAKS